MYPGAVFVVKRRRGLGFVHTRVIAVKGAGYDVAQICGNGRRSASEAFDGAGDAVHGATPLDVLKEHVHLFFR